MTGCSIPSNSDRGVCTGGSLAAGRDHAACRPEKTARKPLPHGEEQCERLCWRGRALEFRLEREMAGRRFSLDRMLSAGAVVCGLIPRSRCGSARVRLDGELLHRCQACGCLGVVCRE